MGKQAYEFDGLNGDEVKQFAGWGIVAGKKLTVRTEGDVEVEVAVGEWVVKERGRITVAKAVVVEAEKPKPAEPVEPQAPEAAPKRDHHKR